MVGRYIPCDIVLLFCTVRHDQQALREAVSSVVGADVPIYGGGAVGIITNHTYGYAGYQVGIACLWLDGARCDVALDGGLPSGEEETGFRLGRELARLGVTPDASAMLLYNAVIQNNAGTRMMMATWIMAGLEKALGFLPSLYGAGLTGDHACSPIGQYIGKETGSDWRYAMTFLFGDDIRIDSAVMHGCRPASPYYTVTRADGPTILEINGTPALDFMDELLGSAISPEQYPFFLLLGINYGEQATYNPDTYASRLCFGIDRDRGGIVMFEPDMIEGTKFQVMFRSFDLEYMKPKIEALFEGLHGRKPVFGMYIDCAGRCAGFGGTDMEDAMALQQAVAGRVPILGIYTGVEIAPVSGRPRSLDWTGVFCLFSQGESETFSMCENTVRYPNVYTSDIISLRKNFGYSIDLIADIRRILITKDFIQRQACKLLTCLCWRILSVWPCPDYQKKQRYHKNHWGRIATWLQFLLKTAPPCARCCKPRCLLSRIIL